MSSANERIVANIPRADHDVEFVAGALALDFTNTVGGTHASPTHDHLSSYEDLVDFGRRAGYLSAGQARHLIAEARRQPSRAMSLLRRAIALREAIWRVFDALAKGARAQAADIATVTDEATAARGRKRFALGSDGLGHWEWPADELPMERPLWAVADSAAELLASREDLTRIRECSSATCEWLFIDKSRNHSRRWCAMSDCGNRAKVRRFRERQRAP